MNFDTHATIKALQEAGLGERQAEAITAAIGSSQNDLVTKDVLRAELRDLEIKIYKFGIAVAAIAVAILKLT